MSVTGKVLPLIRMVLRLPTPVPASMGYFFTQELKREVNALLAANSYDLIFVHCSSVAQFVSHDAGLATHFDRVIDFAEINSVSH